VFGYDLQFDFDDYNIVFAPFNSGNHWELAVVFPPERNIAYLNPLGELQKDRKRVHDAFCKFFASRSKSVTEKRYGANWKEKVIQHTKQQDSHSCGVHIIKVCILSYMKIINQYAICFIENQQLVSNK
jgi:Ulp1 family protease